MRRVRLDADDGWTSEGAAVVSTTVFDDDLAFFVDEVGLAHVIGLGSACGVHILEKSAA